MKKTIFILLFFVSYLSDAQTEKKFTEKIDSVVVKTYSYYNKETSAINDTLGKNSTTLVNSKKLTKTEINILNKKIKLRKSFSKKRALMSHFNIKIIYYNNNRITQDITYSSITKNLTIYKLDKCIFKGQTTPFLDKEINKILNK